MSVVILVGMAFGTLAKLVRLPSVTGQILAGVLIGKIGLNLFGDQPLHNLEPLTHFALGLIAVTVGAHLNIRRLRNAGKRLFLLLLTESIVTPVVVFLVICVLGRQSPSRALLFATVAIATAPATIIALVKETRSKGVFVKTLIAAVALNNMSCILLFEIARAFASRTSDEGAGFTANLIVPAMNVLKAVGVGGCMGLIVELVARLTVRRERFATVAVVAILLVSGIANSLGVSPLLACLFMGMVQTNLSAAKNKRVESAFEDFEPAILTIFFTLAGMHLSLGSPSGTTGQHAMALAGLLTVLFVLSRIAGKLLAADLAMRWGRTTDQVRKNLGIALVPQAGVAVGLVILIQEDSRFVDFAGIFTAVILTAVTFNEIVGPILTRMALNRSGEVAMDRSRLIDFISEENIIIDLSAKDMPHAIEQLVDLLISSHNLHDVDRDMLLKSVLDRESEISTCLGSGLAIPHGELQDGDRMLGVMGLSHTGLSLKTPDKKPIHCIILLATPLGEHQRHLQVLAALAEHIGTDVELQQNLFSATSAAHAYDILHGEKAEDFNYFLEKI